MKWGQFFRYVGRGVNNLFFVILLIWGLPWFCIFGCIALCCEKEVLGGAIASIGVFIDAVVFVILLHYFGVYNEVQSLEISFLTYWLCFSSFMIIELIYEHVAGREKYAEFERSLFKIFQVDKKYLKNSDMDGVVFHYGFVSLVPAITTGYIANWILENRYTLYCDESISVQQSAILCGPDHDNQSCCKVEFINTDIYEFFGIAFANIFAGYKITSVVVRFLFSYYWYDEDIQNDDFNEEKVKKMVAMAIEQNEKEKSMSPNAVQQTEIVNNDNNNNIAEGEINKDE